MPVRGILRILADPPSLRSLSERRVRNRLDEATALLEAEPSLVEIRSRDVLFVGDTHGDFEATVRAGRLLLKSRRLHVIFLGDYEDRGDYEFVNVFLAVLLKLHRPGQVTLLRGNHETPSVNSRLGFMDVIERRFSTDLYERFNRLFSQMPVAALTRAGALAVHGGIAEGFDTLDDIRAVPKGELEDDPKTWGQLLWNDPSEELRGFGPNADRQAYRLFGRDVFDRFMDGNGLSLFVRSHQCFQDGYRYHFDDRLLTIFSSRNYADGNRAAMARVGPLGTVTIDRF